MLSNKHNIYYQTLRMARGAEVCRSGCEGRNGNLWLGMPRFACAGMPFGQKLSQTAVNALYAILRISGGQMSTAGAILKGAGF